MSLRSVCMRLRELKKGKWVEKNKVYNDSWTLTGYAIHLATTMLEVHSLLFSVTYLTCSTLKLLYERNFCGTTQRPKIVLFRSMSSIAEPVKQGQLKIHKNLFGEGVPN
ncbi:hypothetical protein Y032_0047g1447 [Ancylostoma ceylanicum]|uniref:Uncharacterized protein n=1 Tax=Ancylostoma ceylanicum TaxID=53326 RepID=A0A016UCN4_9BILA|nr:hypothetical protein Y032_0047g1447 [Ancylostoma ceylanicum]